MKARKLIIATHRDIGYFFAGLTVLYAISGVAVNHIDDWNPSYVVRTEVREIGELRDGSRRELAAEVLPVLEQLHPGAGRRISGVAERLAQEADRTNTRRKQADIALKEEAVAMAEPYVGRGDPGLHLLGGNSELRLDLGEGARIVGCFHEGVGCHN